MASRKADFEIPYGWGHDQADTEWIVIRMPLRGHNRTPFGRPTPGRPIGHKEVGRPYRRIWWFLVTIN
jgi:hypothetical protein